jgi:hypothetical protein
MAQNVSRRTSPYILKFRGRISSEQVTKGYVPREKHNKGGIGINQRTANFASTDDVRPLADVPVRDGSAENEWITFDVFFGVFVRGEYAHGFKRLIGPVEKGASHKHFAFSIKFFGSSEVRA